MPQYQTRSLLPTIAGRISALYQLGIIDEDTKNKLARLAKIGLSDNYDALYQYIGTFSNPHPLLEEIRDMILFQ